MVSFSELTCDNRKVLEEHICGYFHGEPTMHTEESWTKLWYSLANQSD